MEYVIKGREPVSLFRFFEEISAIPRPSYHEERVADYLERFADARGLECHRDKLHNVLIKAPATETMRDRAPILLQGHIDMVCEKNADVEHDFLCDPLRLWVDGDLLRAKGTTLGADNGIGAAIMLAVLDGAIAEHPSVECLFTTAEEVGLDGAAGFDYSLISSKRMMNLDSEDLGVITCGCAGGVRSDLMLAYTPEIFSGDALRVSITGLMGGHSGENIKDGRANANRLMGRLLALLQREQSMRLVTLDGGSKDNAIPRECAAVIAVEDAERASGLLTDALEQIAAELGHDDEKFSATVEEIDVPTEMLSERDTARAIAILAVTQNGVLEMSRDVAGLVESSRNLGVVRTDGDQMVFTFSSRSAIEGRVDAAEAELDALARVMECKIEHRGRYPGWSYAPQSPLRDAYREAYRRVTDKDAHVKAIHAGLECGIVRANCPEMDIISIGPTLYDIHSPAEAMPLGDVETFWKTLEVLFSSL